MRRVVKALAATAMLLLTVAPALARSQPLLDCPLRDAPWSIDSPLIDVLLHPEARRLAEQASGIDFSKGPRDFLGTAPPTFAAILTIKEAAAFMGANQAALPQLDRQLRALPVSRADRIARCARYDNDRPKLVLPKGKVRLLLFEKINGFRDSPSVDAAHAALTDMAKRQGWALVSTDKGGAFNPASLARFDAVIWNNVSGDVLTLSQRRAFRRFLAKGGGYIGLHGSAGDPVSFWDWYVDGLIGARFAGHPMQPQFQEARITVAGDHPLATGLPSEWRMTDEWYSFKTNPRTTGARVLLRLDERSYVLKGMAGERLEMGADHPLAWSRCIGRGRMFYSAIGHLPATYGQAQNVRMLENAIAWSADRGAACHPG